MPRTSSPTRQIPNSTVGQGLAPAEKRTVSFMQKNIDTVNPVVNGQPRRDRTAVDRLSLRDKFKILSSSLIYLLPHKVNETNLLRPQTTNRVKTNASQGFPKGFPFGGRKFLRGGIEPPLKRFFSFFSVRTEKDKLI